MHVQQVPMQIVWVEGEKKKAFNIDTSGNDVNIQPQHVFMERTISDITTLLQKRVDTSQPTVVLFQWQEHNDQQCKVNTAHMYIM